MPRTTRPLAVLLLSLCLVLPALAEGETPSPAPPETRNVVAPCVSFSKGVNITVQYVPSGLPRDQWLLRPVDESFWPSYESAVGNHAVVGVVVDAGEKPVQISTMGWQLVAGDQTLDQVRSARDVPFDRLPSVKTIQAGTRFIHFVVFPKVDEPVGELTLVCPAHSFAYGDSSTGGITNLDFVKFVLTGPDPRSLDRSDIRREKAKAATPLFASDAAEPGSGTMGTVQVSASVGGKPCGKMTLFAAEFDWRETRDSWLDFFSGRGPTRSREWAHTMEAFSSSFDSDLKKAKAANRYGEVKLDKSGAGTLKLTPGEYYLSTMLSYDEFKAYGWYDDGYRASDGQKWMWVVRVQAEAGKTTKVVLTERNGKAN